MNKRIKQEVEIMGRHVSPIVQSIVAIESCLREIKGHFAFIENGILEVEDENNEKK